MVLSRMSGQIPQELINKIGQVALTIAYGVYGLGEKQNPRMGTPPAMINLGASSQEVKQQSTRPLPLIINRPAAAAGTPAAGTPAAGTPAAGTPAAGTPAAGTPAAGTPAPAGIPPPAPAAAAAPSPGARRPAKSTSGKNTPLSSLTKNFNKSLPQKNKQLMEAFGEVDKSTTGKNPPLTQQFNNRLPEKNKQLMEAFGVVTGGRRFRSRRVNKFRKAKESRKQRNRR